jgi:hypothetical protein
MIIRYKGSINNKEAETKRLTSPIIEIIEWFAIQIVIWGWAGGSTGPGILLYMYINVRLYVSMYIFIFECIYICKYVYMYIYTYLRLGGK